MLPLYLSIQGLYSYQDKQEIDFTKLTEAGLFGIFGNVGSGKSSILEAISYALYGETERLNKQEKRAYNMLNLKSNQAIIDFQFLNFENRKFRFVIQWKRRKRFEDTTTVERTAYEWKDSNWIPMESVDGSAVTNLSYANFRRTIIIPQGQFKEFLELKGKDRSDMMKEIFFLNKYDLGPKVGILQAENNRLLENLKGALSGFENISEENKELKAEELKVAQKELSFIRNKHSEWSEKLKVLVAAQANRQDLDSLNKEWHILQEQLPDFQKKELELSEYETALLHFKEHLNKKNVLNVEKETVSNKIDALLKKQEHLSNSIAANKEQLVVIELEYSQLDSYKKQLVEFDILLQIQDSSNSKIELEARVNKGIPLLNQKKEEEVSLTNDLSLAEKNLELLKNKKINTDDLLAIGNWYQIQDELNRQYLIFEKQKLSIAQDIHSLKQKFKDRNYTTDNWQENIEQELEKVKLDLQQLLEKETSLLLKEELSQYAMNLHNGVPCPLCGSEEHPNVMHTKDLSHEKQNLQQSKNTLSTKENSLRSVQLELITTSKYLVDRLKEQSQIENELQDLSDKIVKHDLEFIWNDFDKNNKVMFEKQKAFVRELEQSINLKENEIKSIRENLSLTKENVQKYQKSIDDIQNKIQILESNIVQNRNLIKELQSILAFEINKDELISKAAEVKRKITEVEENYKKWNASLQESQSQLASINGQLNELNTNLMHLKHQEITLYSLIERLLLEFGFENSNQIKSILAKNLDISSIKTSIQQFRLKLNTLSVRIEELNKGIANDNFTEEGFEESKKQVELLSSSLELQISHTGALEKELERILIELSKKSTLLEKFNALNSRKENLKTLDNMFKGSGFVNYVSSIHLERLCEIANQRFQRLTKNQLSLCVNESNEFEVKDFLNNGYQRSVKTLSGGQSFQASLCLALALAENIQALNKAERNFFFIDEGFGTQDNESINTVFDTLQYLHQENRVVGIISHVEELKERMPRSISITKDMEKGSQIRYN